jgi:hypothetical protein
MPTLHSTTKSKASNGQYSLVLVARHRLQYGQPSEDEPIRPVKSTLPAQLDVLLASNLVLTFEASVNQHKLAPETVATSGFAQHLNSTLLDVCCLSLVTSLNKRACFAEHGSSGSQ